ncbi:MAG: hypothetical protein [Bacteriophage sp.]|nr:MAG: hypothetical protein [Bacteriophage sp.]
MLTTFDGNVYLKTETDTLLSDKANVNNVYSKTELQSLFTEITPFPTTDALLAYVPSTVPCTAKAMDTRKIYFYGKLTTADTSNAWHDMGLGDLEQAKAFANRNFSSTHPILIDRNKVLSSDELAIYLPCITVFAKIGSLQYVGDVANAKDTNVPTHTKVVINPSAVNTLYFDFGTNLYKLATYPDFPIEDTYIPLISLWNNNIVSNYMGLGIQELNSKTANRFRYSIGDDTLSVPQLYGNSEIVSVTHATLNGLGITRGVRDSHASNRPYMGDDLFVKLGDWVFFRCYVQTNTADTYSAVQVYLWNSTTVVQTCVLTKQSSIDSNLAIFSGVFKIAATDVVRYLMGAETQNTAGLTHVISGIQCAVDQNYIYGIRSNDYPRYVTTTLDLTQMNARNIARSNAIQNIAVTSVQKPTAKYNTKIAYGQSLARGQESFPALSTVNRYGNMMYGDNTLPNGYDADTAGTYVPFGTSVLKPLVASVVNDAGTQILSTTDVNALGRGNGAFGEPANIAWTNGAKYYLNQMLMTNNDSRIFVTFNAAVSGRTIEQLSKGQTVDTANRFGRFQDGIAKIHAAAGSDHVVDGIFFAQGEFNYIYAATGTTPVTSLKYPYKVLFGQLIDDAQNACMAITGQQNPPAFFTYQTGAGFTRDVSQDGTPGLNIGMAQLEVALTKPNTFMVTPIYHLTDKGGHLDSNGYRWLGNYIAKVHHKVVHLGQNWQPLHPTSIKRVGNAIYINFHVPSPPLKFKVAYDQTNPIMQGGMGFKVTDDSTGNQIQQTAVEIVADTIVKITLASTPNAPCHVWYASELTGGQGNLCDSDPFVAVDKYTFIPNSSMYAEANIPDLVNKPYPLENWCVAFYYPVGFNSSDWVA